MSTTRNTDAVANQAEGGGSGEFKPRIERDEPMTTKGHKPGINVGNDAVPEFNAETLPAGTAPASRTFQPNPQDESAPTGRVPADADENVAPGATSADVHTGIGHPGAGQTSRELRHDGDKSQGKSLEGVGASTTEFKTVDERKPEFAHHRALDNDEAVGGRGDKLSAEDREPVSADTVAAEKK